MATDDEIIRKRLLIDGDGSGDERRFNTLMKMFTKWCNSNDQDNATLQRMHSLLAQCEFAMTKSTLVHEMNLQQMNRYKELQNQIETNVDLAKTEIEKCKEDVKAAKLERKNRQEYDALATIVMKHSDRKKSMNELKKLNSELEDLQRTQFNLESKLELRKKQFRSLLITINSLQETLNEESVTDESLNDVDTPMDES